MAISFFFEKVWSGLDFGGARGAYGGHILVVFPIVGFVGGQWNGGSLILY